LGTFANTFAEAVYFLLLQPPQGLESAKKFVSQVDSDIIQSAENVEFINYSNSAEINSILLQCFSRVTKQG
jgi:hypothetical protein